MREKNEFNSFGVGLNAGYQFVDNGGFILDINAGCNYFSFKYKDNGIFTDSLKTNTMLPSFGIALGYSF
jgi:hypothetical protein